jgi:hypothetical protein
VIQLVGSGFVGGLTVNTALWTREAKAMWDSREKWFWWSICLQVMKRRSITRSRVESPANALSKCSTNTRDINTSYSVNPHERLVV